MKIVTRNIANVLNASNRRVGIVVGKKITRFFFFEKVSFCFMGKDPMYSAFFGWCDKVEDVRAFIMKKYPDSSFGEVGDFDVALDAIENLLRTI